MNQKGFTNIIVIGIAVAMLLGVAGYFVFVKQLPTPTQTQLKIPSSPTKLSSGDPRAPLDEVLAEITVLSQTEDEWKLRVDKIRDYIRYPAATNPELKAGDTVSIRFNGWEVTSQYNEKVCPVDYVKRAKKTDALGELELTTQTPVTRPQLKITVGEKYLAKLYGCFIEVEGFTCPNQKSGWSGWLYNPYPIVIEYECVKPESGIIPSAPPAVESQR